MGDKLGRKRVKNVVKKEWKVIFSNLNSALFVTLLPFIIVVQAVILIYVAVQVAGADALMNTILKEGMVKWVAVHPEVGQLSVIERFLVFFMGQIPFYFLVIPVMVAMSFATFSIVEEKQTRTLEPLLATPVRTWELLLGKSLAGLLPALVLAWICAGVFLVIITGMDWGHLLPYVLRVEWFISLFVLVPLISLLAFMLGVIGSSRARDAKSAQNIAVVAILPVLGIVGVQLTGIVVFFGWALLVLCAGMVIANAFVLWIAVKLFARESIVVKWDR